MQIRTERFYADGEKNIEEGEMHDEAESIDVARALTREMQSSPFLEGIRVSWIDTDGRHHALTRGKWRGKPVAGLS